MKKLWSFCCVVCGLFPLAAFGQITPPQRQITVMGEAVVNVEPDKVIVTLGIETSHKDITTAKAENTRVVQKVTALCGQHGVEAGNIRTDHLYIEPRYDDYYQKTTFLGYFVRSTLAVTITDVTTLDALLTALLQNGVNYVHGVEFQTTQFKEHRQQARELALQAAREKAAQMTAVLGVTIGQVTEIAEMDNASNWWYSSWWGYGRSQSMSQNVMQNAGGEGPSDPTDSVALGKIAIRAKVQVTFALE